MSEAIDIELITNITHVVFHLDLTRPDFNLEIASNAAPGFAVKAAALAQISTPGASNIFFGKAHQPYFGLNRGPHVYKSL